MLLILRRSLQRCLVVFSDARCDQHEVLRACTLESLDTDPTLSVLMEGLKSESCFQR